MRIFDVSSSSVIVRTCPIHYSQCPAYSVVTGLHTAQCTLHSMHNAQCTMLNAQCSMHNAHCTMHNAHCIQCTMHNALNAQCTLYNALGVVNRACPDNVHWTARSTQCNLFTALLHHSALTFPRCIGATAVHFINCMLLTPPSPPLSLSILHFF